LLRILEFGFGTLAAGYLPSHSDDFRKCRRILSVIQFVKTPNGPPLAIPFAALGLCVCTLGSQAGVLEDLSPFGIGSCHSNNYAAQANANWIPKMTAIGVTNHRTCNTGWSEVEPERGKWAWEAFDAQMDYLENRKIAFGGILMGDPKWNQTAAGFGLPVHNLPGWSRYVSEVVKHANGRIRHWEVWNEPPNGTRSDQTPADYAKILISAYDAAKAADPKCLIGLAAKSVHVNYLEQVIMAGAKDHFDYITLHPYEVLNGVADDAGTEAVYMNIVPVVRKMLAARNPAKVNVPVIFTELGSDSSKGIDHQARALVKAYTMGIAQGVTCIQWFEGMDGDSGPMGLLDGKGNPRPAYTAYAQLIRHLGQHPVYQGWLLLNDKNHGFIFKGAKSSVLVTWAPKGPPDRVSFGHTVEIVDPLSGQTTEADFHDLTNSPVLVIDPPAAMVAMARGNRNKSLPWGGDFTRAESVSVTMGGRNVERGLHTLSGAAVAEAVVAYGGSARAGSVPGGNLFIVDPGFLSYTSTPIEITAVVRRNEANDNSGFKLVYESTDGFKTSGGWYTIPDNKEWHTVRWKIDDAQFVNFWGYNFALESDGNTYNKYYIRSVTVTKSAK
jgi:hypothetical protein